MRSAVKSQLHWSGPGSCWVYLRDTGKFQIVSRTQGLVLSWVFSLLRTKSVYINKGLLCISRNESMEVEMNHFFFLKEIFSWAWKGVKSHTVHCLIFLPLSYIGFQLTRKWIIRTHAVNFSTHYCPNFLILSTMINLLY